MPFLSSESVQPWPEDAIEVGRILGAWGVKGAFRVQPFAADPQALFSCKHWFLKPAETGPGPAPAAARAAIALPATLQVSQAREQGDSIVATAHEVPDRDTAELLKGVRIFVSRASFPQPDADEFYWVDLIGCSVSNLQGVALGTVVGLIETGPHCVLRVQPAEGTPAAAPPAADGEPGDERLIPFVDAYVDSVDMSQRRVVVDWGLDY
jgi:16S rRNA processing protein RimM